MDLDAAAAAGGRFAETRLPGLKGAPDQVGPEIKNNPCVFNLFNRVSGPNGPGTYAVAGYSTSRGALYPALARIEYLIGLPF